MASLLQKSTPWIEDSFVYACSFDANRYDGLESDGLDSDLNDDEEIIMEPQTDNTIPAGLLDDDNSRVGVDGRKNIPPPTRVGKIVQIIDRGGDPNFYVMKQQQKQSDGKNNQDCCPPYLILHDGKYSTIAFLSEEAYHSSMMRQDVASIGTKQPKAIPRKSLVSISQYTISTIKCCAQSKEKQKTTTRFKEDVLPIQLVRPDMPRDHLSQVQMSINTNLLLCLYLLGPITFIGAENQGLIGDPINVNCSIKVRRVLISHMAQFDRAHKEHTSACVNVEEEEEEDYQHWTMVQRLEACHVYYQLLKEQKGGMIPAWPWESRLVGGESGGEKVENAHAKDDGVVDLMVDQAASATTAAVVASPGRVERMIRKYENLEELLQEGDDEKEEGEGVDDFADAAAVGDKRAGRASTGTYLAKWDSDDEQQEKAEEEDVEDQRVARASTGTYLAKWDSEDDQEEVEEMEAKTKGNADEQVQHQQEQVEEDGEKEKGTNTKEDSPIEQGNVAELFDNFEDINDVLDLEEDEPSVIAEEEEVSASANAVLESNDNDVEYLAEHGEDNETTEKSEEHENTQDDNAATFVGIDQMFVESDDDEREEDEEEEDEEAPLLTQQEVDSYKDDEVEPASGIFEPSQEDTESQILLPPVKVNKKSIKSSRGHGHLKRYVESQIPFQLKGMQPTDEKDGGAESQIPLPPSRKHLHAQSLHESDNEDDLNNGDIGTESQIPFLPCRKQLNEKSSESEDEEIGCNIMAESQIPLPPRRKQHTESLDHHTETSKVQSPQKQLMKKASPRKPNRKNEITYDSEDEWMRIRNVRPISKPTNRAQRVQSQMAGEGSEEIVPTKVLDTSLICDFEDEAGEEIVIDSTGTSEEEIKQHQPESISPAQKGPSSSAANTATSLLSASNKTRTTHHHVHFAMEVAADATAPPTTQRELFTSVSNKASEILLQSSRASNEPASRKRKVDEDQGEMKRKREFSFGNMFDRVKRLWPSHSDDSDEEGEV